ncbi:unnamed protein product, partial [Iphiclides podalirius]
MLIATRSCVCSDIKPPQHALRERTCDKAGKGTLLLRRNYSRPEIETRRVVHPATYLVNCSHFRSDVPVRALAFRSGDNVRTDRVDAISNSVSAVLS